MQAFMLFVHVLLAIVIFGSVIMAGRLASAFKDKPVAEGLPALRLANKVEKMLGPATLLVPLFGLGMVFSSDGYYELGQLWVWLSLVLYAIAAALGPGFALRTENEMIAKLEVAPPNAIACDIVPKEIRRLEILEGVLWGLLIAIIALMVWRPGAPFNVNDLAA